jgi:hypothetical protein
MRGVSALVIPEHVVCEDPISSGHIGDGFPAPHAPTKSGGATPPVQDTIRDPMSYLAFPKLWHGLTTMPQQRPARPHRPVSFPVALPATICHEKRCSTYGVGSENVVIASRSKVENDLG